MLAFESLISKLSTSPVLRFLISLYRLFCTLMLQAWDWVQFFTNCKMARSMFWHMGAVPLLIRNSAIAPIAKSFLR
jgi:hypothetical protein